MDNNILKNTAHRPAPLPKLPWIMTQKWEDVLFLHWPVPAEMLKVHVPAPLEVDTFFGNAWIGIVAFKVSDLKFRWLPRIPFVNTMQEVNLRTYVKYGNKHGTYFFSLDASKLAAVIGGNVISLPYKMAQMDMKNEDKIHFYSRRQDVGKQDPIFHINYRPLDEDFTNAKPHTLTHWFIERYLLWTVRGKKVYQGNIHHNMWMLSRAKAKIYTQTLTHFLPDTFFESPPLLHYSPMQRAFIWPLQRV